MVEKKFLYQKNGYVLHSYQGNTEKTWYFEYYDTNGKPQKITFGINRVKDAKARYELAIKKLDIYLHTNQYHHANQLAAALMGWLETKTFDKKNTKDTYKSKIGIFIKYCETNHQNTLQISPNFAQNFINSLSLSNTTKNAYKALFLQIYNDFLKNKLVKNNPFADIKKLKEKKQSKMFFNSQQVEFLRPILEKNKMVWLGCQLQYYCFVRPNNELRHIRFNDFDLDSKTLRINSQAAKNGTTQYVRIPKAFMPVILAQFSEIINPNYYFINNSPNPLCEDSLSKKHNKFIRALGFGKEFTFYSWKHTGAAMAVKAGVGLKELQLQLRHHSLDMVNEYLKDLGILDMPSLFDKFPSI